MASQEILTQDFYAYSVGFVYMSVCVGEDMGKEDVEKRANHEYPLLGGLRWQIANEPFKTGEANPHKCEIEGNRKHYLLVC